jgi:hypothetical protein
MPVPEETPLPVVTRSSGTPGDNPSGVPVFLFDSQLHTGAEADKLMQATVLPGTHTGSLSW